MRPAPIDAASAMAWRQYSGTSTTKIHAMKPIAATIARLSAPRSG